ncbi:dTDP-4-dehydrorhamnose reductase [Paenibacillus sp. MMS18-CY102]|uniref:dTDP-4-dehydrorhamnose reductase n=1 Tax=Paenibacillus sp. MMS18-CY102 TaxID=2682849 RepID=UPI00136623D6|nr:dTDP-4-dehydrorhamnose reductase [Paenibacillus sp. MMS18-CY102]MWC30423.1 dTDP-4-dehydrorhamnose reductase [Paenibacillus sp. MMS18-CY102]
MAKQRIVVTGANGQLGVDLVKHLAELGHEVHGLGRTDFDVTSERQVQQVLRELKPDVVIHSGAYTKVDQAEDEPDQAYMVNGYGTANVASAAHSIGAKLVYVSTDYVFNGQGFRPYDEFSPIDPVNVYGKSKWMGERFVETLHARHYIVRTSWVYGAHGANFVKTMLKLGAERGSVSVVNDQVGCPTFTKDLAACIGRLIETERYGTYHVSNSGSCSWHEFAEAIFRLAGLQVELAAVSSEQFVRPAKRPSYSVFDHMSLRLGGFPAMRHWEEALEQFITELNDGSESNENRTAIGRIG